MKASFPLLAALLATATLSEPAHADASERLTRAREQIVAARFDEAEAEVRAALASGELERSELAQAHLLAGVIAAARRDDSAARASFRKALSLDPRASLPALAGPHVAQAFDAARAELGAARAGLAVSASVSADPGAPAQLGVRVLRDAEGLARELRVRAGELREQRPLPPHEQRIEVPRPGEGCVELSAEVVDASGNRVWSSPALGRVCAEPAAAAPPAAKPVAAERPVGAPVWIGLALTGAGVVTTSVLGVLALDRRGEYHDANVDPRRTEAERRELYSDAQGAGRRATAAAVVTTALAAATVTLYVLRPERSPAALGVSTGPSGAGAVLGGRF